MSRLNFIKCSVDCIISLQEIIQSTELKVNIYEIIESSENIITSDMCAIARILDELEFNDQLENIRILFNYIIGQKRAKIKRKRWEKPYG